MVETFGVNDWYKTVLNSFVLCEAKGYKVASISELLKNSGKLSDYFRWCSTTVVVRDKNTVYFVSGDHYLASSDGLAGARFNEFGNLIIDSEFLGGDQLLKLQRGSHVVSVASDVYDDNRRFVAFRRGKFRKRNPREVFAWCGEDVGREFFEQYWKDNWLWLQMLPKLPVPEEHVNLYKRYYGAYLALVPSIVPGVWSVRQWFPSQNGRVLGVPKVPKPDSCVVQLEERVKSLETNLKNSRDYVSRLTDVRDDLERQLAKARFECDRTKKVSEGERKQDAAQHRAYLERLVGILSEGGFNEACIDLCKVLRKELPRHLVDYEKHEGGVRKLDLD